MAEEKTHYYPSEEGKLLPGQITHVASFPFALTPRQHLELYLALQGKQPSLWQRVTWWLADLYRRWFRKAATWTN